MKNKRPKLIAAFTLPELLVVVAVIGVLGALLLPDLSRKKAKSLRISCVSRHKSIGTSFRVFASDNGGKYPLEARTNPYIVQSGATGTQVNATSAAAWQVAQCIWYQEQSPISFLCPSDRERFIARRATDFNGLAGAGGILTKVSLGHAGNQNNAVSYAFSVVAAEGRPLGVLMMDRNVNNVGTAGASVVSNVALTNTRAVMNATAGPTQVVWVKGTAIHGIEGNLAYADGSVQQSTAEMLRQALENAAKSYSMITNQNQFLFP